MIPFTFQGYRSLLGLLRERGYIFADYHNYSNYPQCVILRHDMDNSIEKAVTIAKIEAEFGVKATYFVLLKTDFYNPASRKSLEGLRHILSLGHELGLHFDEMAYDGLEDATGAIKKEVSVLSEILDYPVTTVSMHRPSQRTLDANYDLSPLVNSYGKRFFNDFKYLSDSRRRWREPILDMIKSGQYDRLHILTHPIWYNEIEEDIHATIKRFIVNANKERYIQESENIKDMAAIMDCSELYFV